MLNNYFCVFWKSGENFDLEELINPMLAGYNFTENFIVEIAVGISETSKTISTALSLDEFTHQLLLKVQYNLQLTDTLKGGQL